MNQSRKISYDILRIVACFSVVMLHVASRFLWVYDIRDIDFKVANFYDSISRFGVPVFVMLSGALMLSPDYKTSTKKIWSHNIFRIVMAYIVWGLVYYIYQSVFLWQFPFWKQGPVRWLNGVVYSSTHFWYLGMIFGLYALVPIIKTWLVNASKKQIEYFLILFILFQVIRSSVLILCDSSLLYKLSDDFAPVQLTGYLGYFILGYYLTTYMPGKKLRLAVYISVPVSIFANYFISAKMTEKIGVYSAGIYDSFGIFTFLEVVAIFMAIVYGMKDISLGDKACKIVGNLSKDTFGIYLVHILLIDIAFDKGIFILAKPCILWQIPISIAVFVMSCIMAAVIRRIPFIGKIIC